MPGELATEKPPEQGADSEGEKKEPPASKPVVGIIYPPPEVRNIVDKTADFVARNGPEFEGRIRLNEAGNTKFNFLNPYDPYHAYYRHKVLEVQEGVAQEAAMAITGQLQQAPPKPPPIAMVTEPEVPKEPPPEWEFMADPPSISALELNVVKLTAQFVARNGAQFLDKLMMREQRNFQFDFLRKQHPLFNYFTKLVEQHSKVLLPPLGIMDNLKGGIEDPLGILDCVDKRVEWEQYQQRQRRKAEEKEERERMEYAQVDWHDFVLVETINFRESESGYLPPPIKPTQLAQRLLQQQKYERLAEEGEVQEIEMEVEETEETDEAKIQDAFTEQKESEERRPPSPPPPPSQQPPPPPPGTGVQIRRDYNPKVARPPVPQPPSAQQFLISPITGEKIPADKMQEHMRYGLLDPRWIEKNHRQMEKKKNREEVFAEGMQIGSHLKQLAERRTDIFGVEETIIGQKIGEEDVRKKAPVPSLQWDGHAASAEAVQRQAQAKVSLEEQIEAIHKEHGLTPNAQRERIGPKHILPPPHPFPLPPPPPTSSHLPLAPPPRSQGPMGAHHPRPLFPTPPLPPPHNMAMPPPPPGVPPPAMQPPRPPMPPGALMPTPPGPTPPLLPPHLPNSAPPVPQFPPSHLPPPLDIAPPVAKRMRTEAEDLVPEREFIAKNPGSVTFQVQVPSIPDRPEWSLQGQMLLVTLPITDPVSVIKAKISDELGMPAGKQKLQIGTIFIKDSNSLGFYNVCSTTIVQLALKERGGRKR